MAWVAPAIMAASSVAGMVAQNQNSGKSSGSSYYTMQMLPQDMQNRIQGAMNAMPATQNVSFGGQNYPSVYGPLSRAVKSYYTPSGVIPYDTSASSLSGSMAAAAPWWWMMANQAQTQSPQAQANLSAASIPWAMNSINMQTPASAYSNYPGYAFGSQQGYAIPYGSDAYYGNI
jgi:hypothetical protein